MSEVYFKPLLYFYLGAISLLATGLAINPIFKWADAFFLIWSTITGIFLTYRFNDFIDQSEGFKFDLAKFLKEKSHIFAIVQFLILMLPLAVQYLSTMRIITLGVMFVLGLAYSVNLEFKNFKFRIKHIFLLKNILIGLCWAGLIAVGANNLNEDLTIALVCFTTIQVFIGSSIRDLNDIEKDSEEYVHSIPVVLGPHKSFILYHLLNLSSFFVFYLLYPQTLNLIGALIATLWRMLLLVKIQQRPNNRLWSQRLNLLTCSVIFIGQIPSWIF